MKGTLVGTSSLRTCLLVPGTVLGVCTEASSSQLPKGNLKFWLSRIADFWQLLASYYMTLVPVIACRKFSRTRQRYLYLWSCTPESRVPGTSSRSNRLFITRY